MASVVFVQVAEPRVKFFFKAYLLEILEIYKRYFVVDLKKSYNRVSHSLWSVLRECGIDQRLLFAIKSFYCLPEVCERWNSKQSKSFHVGVGLRQKCVLLPVLFIIYMSLAEWMSVSRSEVKGIYFIFRQYQKMQYNSTNIFCA